MNALLKRRVAKVGDERDDQDAADFDLARA
jgi:hypothetical protein